jgi:centromeric protein E
MSLTAFFHSLYCSLLTLSRVIVALGTPNQTHINFRDSKLTRILQPSLSGNARMAVICCATPSELYLEETRSTLQFASRAKLVKTRAQVNEVLDDRSVIRRLQRELALARRRGGGGADAGEHFQALEQKAANAGAAAHEAEDKLRRLQASILNSDGLFGGGSMDALENAAAANPQKRRLSEGALGLGSATPMKGVTDAASPKTVPRANKRSKMETAKSLSPSTELGLLREALMAKKDMMRTWQKKASEISRLVEAKESELIAVNCSNDILRSERDMAKEDLASSIATFRQEMEAMSEAHSAALKEKETAIEKSLAKMEQELEDRKILEQTVDTLQEDKAAAQLQLGQARETTTRLVSENESLQETVQTLGSERNSLLETTQNLETEKESKNETIAGLNEQVGAIPLELEEWEVKYQREVTEKDSIDANLAAAKETIEALQQDQSARQDEISELDEKAAGVSTELEQAKGDLGIAKNTISNLGISLGELTEEPKYLSRKRIKR